ncbi:procollagen-proline 4-dioxygenase [Aureococcus anophagefferens]|nr:procollagen-proline 4-dioxygenase [Aureococcus anophagefferens]
MLSRATTPMLPKFLLLVAATARGAGVSIVVRNLAGEDVVVSWLQPGREPRGRVPQQEKPLKNATTMSINSYETHEFIVASVAPAAAARGRARGADADDNCAFWASVGDLGLDGQEELMAVQYNPGQQYMLHCDGSCDGSPFVAGGRLATVLMYCAAADGGGTAFPTRTGEAREPRAAREARGGRCVAVGGEERREEGLGRLAGHGVEDEGREEVERERELVARERHGAEERGAVREHAEARELRRDEE